APIRDLEEEIGFQLLERTAKSVRLTKVGRAFLDEARSVMQRAGEAVKKARAVAAEPSERQNRYSPTPRAGALPASLRHAHEDYPEYYDYLSIAFSKVKQKPRVVEEHDSMAGILSSVEAGTGVAISADVFGYSYGNRLKRLRLIPEPKPISIGIAAPKERLSPAAEKFLQCAKEAAAKK